ncbi:MAG: hypothetical protein JNK46_06170 [Methylobacteriaceae bacterium]|nr:hypothetical protein [Methylobacteriaceae bacterium]
MSARPLASLLATLDSGGRRVEPARIDPALIEAAAEAARRVGYEEGLAEGERRFAAEKLRVAQAAAENLAAARAAWAGEESAALRARVDEALAEIERRLLEGAAAALRPVVAEAVARLAVERLAVEAARLLAAAEGEAVLRIVAPADMMASLRERFGESPRVECVVGEGPDAVASLGRAVVETRLARWAGRLLAPES